MKTNISSRKAKSGARHPRTLSLSTVRNLFLGASIAAVGAHLHAADETEKKAEPAEKPVELTPQQAFEGGSEVYNNWVELSVGGMCASGSKGAAQQRLHLGDGAFGGIEDLHYQKEIDKKTTFAIDGHALFNEDDYKLSLSLTREDVGYVKMHFEQFRTWYNGNGGFYRPADLWLPPSDETLGIDRGEIGFEAGLRKKGLPQITFEYLHQYREGDKGSTVWGPSHVGFYDPSLSVTRGIIPAFYDIDERRDIFSLDISHHIKSTEFGAGVRYETGQNDDSRKMTQYQGEPVQRRITDTQGTTDNNISAHAWTETWFKNKVLFSSGFLFANLDENMSGSRIYGEDFDVAFTSLASDGRGYLDLNGVLHQKEYVVNMNLMATPFTNFTMIPSVRIDKKDWDAESTALPTSSGVISAADTSTANGNALDVTERLDMRYTGMTNWVFWGRGEWNQGNGSLNENGDISGTILRDTDNSRMFQKYSLGARWYPMRTMTLDVGGYYKNNNYDYDHVIDNTFNGPTSGNRYPAFLVMQDFETYDGNFRVTLRPVQKVTLISRYEYQLSTIHTKPDAVSTLPEVQSSDMTTHIFAQNVSYVPWSRLSLQAGFNYVISETRTAADDYRANGTRALLNAQNNYWTVNFNSLFVVDNKTDLNVGYFYYQSDNYHDNSLDGLPLGAEASEHGVTALVTRRLTPRLRLKVRYAYYHSNDTRSDGHNDFASHTIFSSLQYRF